MNPRVFLDVDPRNLHVQKPFAMSQTCSDELLSSIAELRSLFPEWRLGQLVANLLTAAGATEAGAIWDIEDEQLLAAARRLIERNSERNAARA